MPKQPGNKKSPRLSGQKLRTLRKDARLTQVELGRVLDLSRETISAIENGSMSALSSIGLETVIDWKKECIKRIRSRQLAQESEQGFMQHLWEIFSR